MCPPCTVFTPLRKLSNFKRDPIQVEQEEAEGDLHWNHALDLCDEQYNEKRGFLLEHPRQATSWQKKRSHKLLQRPGIFSVVVDMCTFGLRTVYGYLAKKETLLVTNLYPLAKSLHRHRCQGDHDHQWLLGGKAAAAAQYTPAFVQAILKALHRHLHQFTNYVALFEPRNAWIQSYPRSFRRELTLFPAPWHKFVPPTSKRRPPFSKNGGCLALFKPFHPAEFWGGRLLRRLLLRRLLRLRP